MALLPGHNSRQHVAHPSYCYIDRSPSGMRLDPLLDAFPIDGRGGRAPSCLPQFEVDNRRRRVEILRLCDLTCDPSPEVQAYIWKQSKSVQYFGRDQFTHLRKVYVDGSVSNYRMVRTHPEAAVVAVAASPIPSEALGLPSPKKTRRA